MSRGSVTLGQGDERAKRMFRGESGFREERDGGGSSLT